MTLSKLAAAEAVPKGVLVGGSAQKVSLQLKQEVLHGGSVRAMHPRAMENTLYSNMLQEKGDKIQVHGQKAF